ncbi:TPA: hypothetical protein KSK26_002086 [Clostridioides difficile]|nr:hypothetical protein [Clostridioides difficile]HBH3640250.1 hypothetical protein [Clostridioides difficile]
MMGVNRYGDMLSKIDKFNKILTNGNFRSLDYWVEWKYKDTKSETRREYLYKKKVVNF